MALADDRLQWSMTPDALTEALIEQSATGFLVLATDEQFTVVRGNRGFDSLLDAEHSGRAAGYPLVDLLPTFREGGADEPTYRAFCRVRDTGEPASGDEWEVHGLRQGATYWRWSLAPLRDSGASYHYLLLTCVEVTDQVVARREAEAERRRLAALKAVGQALLTTGEPRGVARAGALALREVLETSLIGVYVHDAERQALVALALPDNLPPEVEAATATVWLDDERSPIAQAFRTGEVRQLALDDPGAESGPSHRLVWDAGVRFAAVAPLEAPGQRIGVVTAGRADPEPFGRQDLELLTSACHHVAAGLARALADEAERRARGRLEVEAERLRVIMENTRAHLAYLDRDFRFAQVNSAYVRGCGHGEEELIGRNHFDFFPNPENQAIFERVRDTGEPYQVLAKPFVYADQPWRGVTYWDWTLTPVKDQSGRVAGLVFSLVDVTDSLRLRQESERRTAELEAILGSIADGVMLYDASGRLAEMNPAAERILERSFAELSQIADPVQHAESFRPLGSDGHDLQPDEMPVRMALRGETVTVVEMKVRRPDGSLVDVLCSAAPIRHPDGQPAGAVVTLQDITPLLEVDRLKDEFISVASHELKSPLTSAKGFCQVLMRRSEKHPGCERCVPNLRAIDTQVNRVVRLVDQLLDLSRLQVGRFVLNREPIDLVEVVTQAVASAQAAAPRHEIRLRAGPDDVAGEWDRTRLEQVIANLLSNAVKYSPQGGPVDVAVASEDNWAVVSVTDRGVGIAKEDQARLFTRYYRTGGPRTAAIEGLGLGLYISNSIVGQHGGSMFVESQPGRGSTFGFRLPLAGQAASC